MMHVVLAVFVGGGSGAVARHYSTILGTRLLGDGFPFGTLFVNVLGALLIGIIMEGSALRWNLPLETKALLVTGFLGGFTTFSAFSLDFFKLWHTSGAVLAAAYVAASVFFSLLAVFAGAYIMRGIMG